MFSTAAPAVHFHPSTFQVPAERRSLRSPPPKPRRSQVSRPPVPPLPLEFVKPRAEPPCLITRKAHVRTRNRERQDLALFKSIVDGGANYKWKLISLREARRRDSIVYRDVAARV